MPIPYMVLYVNVQFLRNVAENSTVVYYVAIVLVIFTIISLGNVPEEVQCGLLDVVLGIFIIISLGNVPEEVQCGLLDVVLVIFIIISLGNVPEKVHCGLLGIVFGIFTMISLGPPEILGIQYS